MTDAARVERLLAAARDTIADVPFCWVMTRGQDGDVNARVVKEATGTAAGLDVWTRWFRARPSSRKAVEIGRTGRVTLAYQHGSGNAYVTLAGAAVLVEDWAALRDLLQPLDDPDGSLAAQLIAVRVTADRLELHVRGVTAEPWGHGRTLLVRDGEGLWGLTY